MERNSWRLPVGAKGRRSRVWLPHGCLLRGPQCSTKLLPKPVGRNVSTENTPRHPFFFFFWCVSFHVKKHHPVMIKVPRLQHPRLSLLAAATLSSSSSSSCCTGSSQRRLPGSVTTRRKPIGYGICGEIVRARGTGDILDLNTSNRGWEEVECTRELKS